MKKLVLFLIISLFGSLAACGSTDESAETVAEEPDKIYLCKIGELCDDSDLWCHVDPFDQKSGILTCDGEEFVSACAVGYYCINTPETPGLYPECLTPFGQRLRCDLETNTLGAEEDAGVPDQDAGTSEDAGT